MYAVWQCQKAKRTGPLTLTMSKHEGGCVQPVKGGTEVGVACSIMQKTLLWLELEQQAEEVGSSIWGGAALPDPVNKVGD